MAELHRIASNLTIRDIQEEVLERGHLHAARVLLSQAEKADAGWRNPWVCAAVQVFHTVLVHLENGVPIQFEDRYVNPAVAPQYLKTDFSQTTPTRHLLTEAPFN